jgi:hypothetical protein
VFYSVSEASHDILLFSLIGSFFSLNIPFLQQD